MSIYKLISYKHSAAGEVISVSMVQNINCSGAYKEQLTFIEDLTSNEKDKLILSMIDEINSLKSSLEDLKATLENYNLIGG